jgi:mRNA interferase MazF
VVVQNNLMNSTALNTVLACPMTSNLRHGRAIGNVTLRRREGGLPQESVVQVAGLTAIDRQRFSELAGSISQVRLAQILSGIVSLLQPREP